MYLLLWQCGDGCLIIAPSDDEVLMVYTEFEVTNKGPIDEYCGVKVEIESEKHKDVTAIAYTTDPGINGFQPMNEKETK